MFYCNTCGGEKKWPIDTLFKSRGTCEICGEVADCNDVPSKYLPVPTPTVKLGKGMQDIQLGGDNDE